MKKLIASSLALLMALSIAACGSKTTPGSASGSTPSSASASGTETALPKEWPSDTITYECGYAAGGTQDLVLRNLAQYAAPITGNTYVCDNITGGSGLIMVNDVYSKDPDGTTACIYSCLIPTVDDFQYFDDELLASLVKADLQIGEQLSAVSQVNTDYSAIYILKSESRYTNFKELAAYIESHPGEISFGATGASGNGGLMLQTFMNKFGWDINDVYYDSTPEIQAGVLSGDIDVMCSTIAANVGDDWICLGYAAESGSDAYPGIATFKESGYEFVATMRRGILVKKGTPTAIIDFMDDMFAQICADEGYIADEEGYGYAVDYADTALFQSSIDSVINGYNDYMASK